MGLFRRLTRVTTGAVRDRVRKVFGRSPSVDPIVEAELARPAAPPRATPPPDVPAPQAEPTAVPPAEPAPTAQVVDGPAGRRSL